MRFISMYRVLNTLSEYTHFYISKNITSSAFVVIFKIVESLQCIFNNTYSFFKELLSGVPQGSILGLILFNIFINDLLLWLSTALHNFADDNTISVFSKDLQELIKKLKTDHNFQ